MFPCSQKEVRNGRVVRFTTKKRRPFVYMSNLFIVSVAGKAASLFLLCNK